MSSNSASFNTPERSKHSQDGSILKSRLNIIQPDAEVQRELQTGRFDPNPALARNTDIDGIAGTLKQQNPSGNGPLTAPQSESQLYQSQLENMECKINLAKTAREKIEAALIGSSGSLMQTIIRSYLTLYKSEFCILFFKYHSFFNYIAAVHFFKWKSISMKGLKSQYILLTKYH